MSNHKPNRDSYQFTELAFYTFTLALMVLVIAVLVIGFPAGVLKHVSPERVETISTVFANFTNPIFSIFAFLLLFRSFIVQNRQFEAQQREIDSAAEISERTALALVKQAELSEHAARVNALKEYLRYVTAKEQEMIARPLLSKEFLRQFNAVKAEKEAAFTRLIRLTKRYADDELLEPEDGERIT